MFNKNRRIKRKRQRALQDDLNFARKMQERYPEDNWSHWIDEIVCSLDGELPTFTIKYCGIVQRQNDRL